MARDFSQVRFRELYDRLIVRGRFNEDPCYYPRYRSRYEEILKRFARHASSEPMDLLDVGGGQLALLAKALWGDRVVLADCGGSHYEYLRGHGVDVVEWNLTGDVEPFEEHFDAVIFSEVIEHLPVPAHTVFSRLGHALRKGGLLLCTTPNLYRPRNIVYMVLGIPIFDHFRSSEGGLGHVIEYTLEHLRWQLERGGFKQISVEYHQFRHQPNVRAFRVLYALGYPLYLFPRWRDNLIATARTPAA